MIKTVNVSTSNELTNRIVTIGDLHGDYKSTIKTLTLSKIINKSHNWTGGNTIVVQLGDILDRGGRDTTFGDENSEVKIINLFYKLKNRPKKREEMLYV